MVHDEDQWVEDQWVTVTDRRVPVFVAVAALATFMAAIAVLMVPSSPF